MSSEPSDSIFDYDRLAADFDRFLPSIQPVTSALLARLPTLSTGARVLDVACGTGEPSLTLARQNPGVRVHGIDAAEGMIKVARSKASRDSLANASFEVAASEMLPCEDGRLDAVVSRFGLLMFGDAPASAQELARVLRPGGHFSVATWESMALNTAVDVVMTTLSPYLSKTQLAPLEHFDELARPGYREDLLRDAGLQEVQSELFSWNYQFSGQEEMMSLVKGPSMFTEYFASMSKTDKEQALVKIAADFAKYRQDDGNYQIPETCRLLWGRR